jgi:hypothetical protein
MEMFPIRGRRIQGKFRQKVGEVSASLFGPELTKNCVKQLMILL